MPEYDKCPPYKELKDTPLFQSVPSNFHGRLMEECQNGVRKFGDGKDLPKNGVMPRVDQPLLSSFKFADSIHNALWFNVWNMEGREE